MTETSANDNYARGRYWKEREYQKSRHQEGCHEEDYPELSSFIPDPSFVYSTMSLSTQALRQHLRYAGAKDPWMINRADIYQKAVTELSMLLDRTPLSESLHNSAQRELVLIAKSLEELFLGHITLSPKNSDLETTIYEGYYFTPDDDETIRVAIYQKFYASHSPYVSRTTPPTCQIHIKEIIGRSSKGGAIAGLDTGLRVGLRCGCPDGGLAAWSVTIDGGLRNHTKGRQIRPISQAIQEIKIHHELEPDNQDTPLAFHYYDPETKLTDPQTTRNKFSFFNHRLGQIFKRYTRN